MHALARKRVQVNRQRGHQRFTFAGLHFGDAALVKHHAAGELHVEVALAECALGCLAHDRKRLWQKIVEGFALGHTLAEGRRLRSQLFVRHRFEFRFQRIDLLHPVEHGTELSLVDGTEKALRDGGEAEHEVL